ncbi:hypothetical protein CapIbe_003887 [Capra ibex]
MQIETWRIQGSISTRLAEWLTSLEREREKEHHGCFTGAEKGHRGRPRSLEEGTATNSDNINCPLSCVPIEFYTCLMNIGYCK